MQIIAFREFCKLPDGTIFSYWKPSVTSGLYRRGEVIFDNNEPIDFFETSLIAESYNCEFPVCDLIESRWGMFEYDQQFAVYERKDIATIIEGLTSSQL